MAEHEIISQSRFYGGQSTDRKEGPENSFWYSRHFDFRKNPSKLTILPATRKEAGVDELIQNMVQDNTGIIWGLGHKGGVFKRSTAGVWTKFGDTSNLGAYGMVYREDLDRIFIANTDRVSQIKTVTNTPKLQPGLYARNASTDSGGARDGGLQTVELQTVSSEQQYFTFTTDIEPLAGLRVKITTLGAGDMTLVVHDAENNLIGTATVANAQLKKGYNDFIFASPARVLVKPNARTYHAHVYSSAAGTSVATNTATGTDVVNGNLRGADFAVIADRFIATRNGMHPAALFNQFVAFGNGRYVSTTEALSDNPNNTEWDRHKITLPPGYEVCGLAQWQEYLAIAAEKITTQTSGTQFQDGKIFFWDGVSKTFNYYIDVPEGSPYSVSCHEQILKYVAGGALYGYAGGRPVKLKTFRNTDSEFTDTTDYTVNYPYMLAVRHGVHLIGFASYTTNTALECGVYSYGAISDEYPNSFGFNHTISTGTYKNTSGNLKIGTVQNFGDTTLISWQDGANKYGIDVIDNNSDPYADATLELLRFDDEKPYKKKNAYNLIVTCDPLPAGVTVIPKYRIDSNDESAWVYGATMVEGDTIKEWKIPQGSNKNDKFLNIDVAIDVTATTITPGITSINMEYDPATTEQRAN